MKRLLRGRADVAGMRREIHALAASVGTLERESSSLTAGGNAPPRTYLTPHEQAQKAQRHRNH
jgi:hypothetical protein